MRYDKPFYSTRRWRDCRKVYLCAHPICHVPGCGQPATQLDHVVSRRDGGAEYDWANLIGGCTSHHSAKTAALDGGFGRAPQKRYSPSVKGSRASGAPSDASHPWNKTP